jgi:hypothetical protein
MMPKGSEERIPLILKGLSRKWISVPPSNSALFWQKLEINEIVDARIGRAYDQQKRHLR